jgi:eukaryotic-like serine/threonine-protein kinase
MVDETRALGTPDPIAARELVAGERVGDWSVVRPIARGGFGSVYEARHARSGQPAALKLLHAHLVRSSEILARFHREIRIIERLDHPSIVRLVDAGFTADDRPFLCMELLAGDVLSDLVHRGPLAPAAAFAVFEPLCDALGVAHELGVIHRDVKAANVIACGDRVVLLDFGIAKLADALDLTATHQALGTPSCMAPEQIQGRRADPRTDVYALGGLLFHMVTGRLPFHDPSPTMTQYLHLHARRPRASAMANVSTRLDDVIARAMAIEPANRFADVRSLLAATRSAMRETAMVRAVRIGPAYAVLVTVRDREPDAALDEELLEDLESVVPLAERYLGEHGYALVVDLGSSALFVHADAPDPAAIAAALWQRVATRPRRHPRVQVGIAVHRDEATFAGHELQAGPLLQLASWAMPEPIEGVWISPAASAPG